MESGTHMKGWDKYESEQQTGQDGEGVITIANLIVQLQTFVCIHKDTQMSTRSLFHLSKFSIKTMYIQQPLS